MPTILLAYRTSLEELIAIKNDINKAVDLFNQKDSRPYQLSLSLGCSMYDPDNDTFDQFLKHMDINMYDEKKKRHAGDTNFP